eukprot:SAG31_NODE_1749_length_7358_cov_6.713872_4_plen_81_part_00
MQDEIFDPLEMNGAGWGVCANENKNVLPMYAYGKFEFVDPLRPWLNEFGDLKVHDNTPGGSYAQLFLDPSHAIVVSMALL